MSEEYDYSRPFRARIIKDCRKNPNKKLDGQFGVCLGQYEYPDITKKMPESVDPNSDEGVLVYNPLIKMDNDKYIWGCECWWTKEEWSKDEPLDRLQLALEEHVNEIRKQANLESKF